MPRIFCVGDIHVSDRPPVNCTDSYTEDIIEILKWIADEAARQQVDAVVWAGDVFHHKSGSKNSHALVLKMVEVVRHYEEQGIELLIVPGNHDLLYDRYESLHATQPLGVLLAAGAKELNGWHGTLPIYGVPWQQNWAADLEPAFSDYRNDSVGGPALAVTHASIFPPGKEPIYDHLLAADVAAAMGNQGYLHFGHIHDDYGIWETEGVQFANPGAISRGSLTESHLTREVKIAVWSSEDGFSELPVPHRPAAEVFRVVEGAAKKEQLASSKEFLAQLGHTQISMTTTNSVVEHIKSMDIEPEVKETAVKLIEETQ